MTGAQRMKANLKRHESNPAARAQHFRDLAARNAGKPAAAFYEARALQLEGKDPLASTAAPKTVVQLSQAPAAATSREIASLKAELQALKQQVATAPAQPPRMTEDQLFAAAVHAFGNEHVKAIVRDSRGDLAERIERALYYSNIQLPHTFSAEAMKHGPAKEPFGVARMHRAEQQRRVDAWLQQRKGK